MAENCVRAFLEQRGCDVLELNVHIVVTVPPQVSILDYVGTVKGRTAIRVFNKLRHLKEKPYWGNHFGTKGYCVDTVGLDSEMIRKYVKHRNDKDKE